MSDQVPNLAIRARPRAVRRFSRKAIIGGGILLGSVMFGALAVALQTPSYDDETSGELYNVAHKPIAEGLELLPKSYAELKPVHAPKLGPPLPGDLGAAYLASKPLKSYSEINQTDISFKPKPKRSPKLKSYASPTSQPVKAVVTTVVTPSPAVINTPESLFFNIGQNIKIIYIVHLLSLHGDWD